MTKVSFKTGEIFSSNCEILTNPINSVGIMGAGLALEFKKRYASTGMMSFYQTACKTGYLKPGARPLLWRAPMEYAPKDSPTLLIQSVLLFPTKSHWNDKSNLADIRNSLLAMQTMSFPDFGLALPMIGCGLGGIRKEDLRPVLEEILPVLNFHHIDVYV